MTSSGVRVLVLRDRIKAKLIDVSVEKSDWLTRCWKFNFAKLSSWRDLWADDLAERDKSKQKWKSFVMDSVIKKEAFPNLIDFPFFRRTFCLIGFVVV